jgi:uncharacterized membrane protein YgcG
MRFALAVLLALCVAAVAVAAEVPYLSGRVVDDAEILKPATRDALAAKLKAHEARTTDQIVVLTVRTIGDASIESFATAVFEQWKLGQKGKDNGVLLIVVPADHKMRIEVGYGLEGTLTDAQAGRIIRNVITPEFKAGDFDGGVSAGVDAMLGVLEGTADLPADDAASASTSSAKFFNQARSAAVAGAHPARRVRLRHHRAVHGRRRDDARHGLVPVFLPGAVLGHVSDHRGGRARRARHAGHVRRRIPHRQAHRVAAAVVREGERGSQAQGHDLDRRLDDVHERRRRQLVVGWRGRWRRGILRGRRQLRRRRRVRQLVKRRRFGDA